MSEEVITFCQGITNGGAAALQPDQIPSTTTQLFSQVNVAMTSLAGIQSFWEAFHELVQLNDFNCDALFTANEVDMWCNSGDAILANFNDGTADISKALPPYFFAVRRLAGKSKNVRLLFLANPRVKAHLMTFMQHPNIPHTNPVLQGFFASTANLCNDTTDLVTPDVIDLVSSLAKEATDETTSVNPFCAIILNSTCNIQANRVALYRNSIRDALLGLTMYIDGETGIMYWTVATCMLCTVKPPPPTGDFATVAVMNALLHFAGKCKAAPFVENWLAGVTELLRFDEGKGLFAPLCPAIAEALEKQRPLITTDAAVGNFFGCIFLLTSNTNQVYQFWSKEYYDFFVQQKKNITNSGRLYNYLGALNTICLNHYNNANCESEKNTALFGTVEFRDILLGLSHLVNEADGAHVYYCVISNIVKSPEQEILYSIPKMYETIINLGQYITSDSAVNTFTACLMSLALKNAETKKMYSTKAIHDLLVASHKYIENEEAAGRFFSALCTLAIQEQGGKVFATQAIFVAFLSAKRFIQSDWGVYYLFAGLTNLTLWGVGKEIFTGEVIRDVFLQYGAYVRGNMSAVFFLTALANVVMVEKNRSLFVTSAMHDLLLRVAQCITISRGTLNLVGVLAQLVSVKDSQAILGTQALRQCCDRLLSLPGTEEANKLYQKGVLYQLFPVQTAPAPDFVFPQPLGFMEFTQYYPIAPVYFSSPIQPLGMGVPQEYAPPPSQYMVSPNQPAYQCYMPLQYQQPPPIMPQQPQAPMMGRHPPPPPTRPPPPRTLQGTLEKMSIGTGLFSGSSWKSRFFKLSEHGMLSYAESETSAPLNSIALTRGKVTVTARANSKNHPKADGMFDFLVSFPPENATKPSKEGQLLLRPANDAEHDKWVASLQAHLNNPAV